jgi:hypothetical protein
MPMRLHVGATSRVAVATGIVKLPVGVLTDLVELADGSGIERNRAYRRARTGPTLIRLSGPSGLCARLRSDGRPIGG